MKSYLEYNGLTEEKLLIFLDYDEYSTGKGKLPGLLNAPLSHIYHRIAGDTLKRYTPCIIYEQGKKIFIEDLLDDDIAKFYKKYINKDFKELMARKEKVTYVNFK